MYTIADYGAMIADAARMGAFARALGEAITPGAVVVDIGTGTGICALLACRHGARRVYAIEPEDAIQVAREIAVANGCADRIEFIQAISTLVTLPERADVIVSDIGGALPWFQRHIPSIVDARTRFLAPEGVLIPQQDVAWAAVVEAPEAYAKYTTPWTDNGFGFDMEPARRLVVNTSGSCTVTTGNLLTSLQRWGPLDYRIVTDPNVRASLSWTVTRPGTGHGLVAGFERTVADGVYLSNAPDAPDAMRPRDIYGTIFFPWQSPVALAGGDLVTVDLEATLIGGDYTWSWTTQVQSREQPGEHKASFFQSTFFGTPVSRASLRKMASSYTPALTEDGRIVNLVLEWMSEGLSLGEIAGRVSAGFPARFPRLEDALRHVADLSRQYG